MLAACEDVPGAAASSKRQSGFIIPEIGGRKPKTPPPLCAGNRFRDSPKRNRDVGHPSFCCGEKFWVRRSGLWSGQWATDLKTPDSVTADKHVQDVFTVCRRTAGLGIDLGVGHASCIPKQMLPHVGGCDQVRLAAPLMPIKTAEDVRLGGSGPIRTNADVVVGKNCPRNRRVVFDFSPQIIRFQPAQDFKISLWGIGLGLRGKCPARSRNCQAQEQGSDAQPGRDGPTFRLQLRAKRLHGS